MPNWCSNEEVIEGPVNEIKSLYGKLNKWTSQNYVENGFGKGWLGNIVIGSGLKIIDDDPENGVHCRGSVEESYHTCDGKTTTGFFILEDENTIRFHSMTAWGPMPEMWLRILENHAPNCNYYFMSEEPGMELYLSNDVDHLFFNDEFYVDVTYFNEDKVPEKYVDIFTDSSYDWTEDELITAMQEITGSDEDDFHKLLEQFNEQERADLAENGYVTINEIKYEEVA